MFYICILCDYKGNPQIHIHVNTQTENVYVPTKSLCVWGLSAKMPPFFILGSWILSGLSSHTYAHNICIYVYCIFFFYTNGFILCILFLLWCYSFKWLYSISLWAFLLFPVVSLLCLFSIVLLKIVLLAYSYDYIIWNFYSYIKIEIPNSSTLDQRVCIFNILEHITNFYPNKLAPTLLFSNLCLY